MSNQIHPTAVVAKGASLGSNIQIGPYSVIDEHVSIADGCIIGPHVHITGHTTIGKENRFHSGAVIGDAPQDLKYADEPTRVIIGDANTFREHVTIHRSNKLEEDTTIGSHGLFMANSHVGHNSHISDHVILANGALLGGHVTVADRVFISGNCLAHQFVRIGRLALMQGGSGISKDLPPFTIARGDNGICGLNVVGLRRAGFNPEQRTELKQTYRFLFRSGLRLKEAISQAKAQFQSDPAKELITFAENTSRGICSDTGKD